MLPTRRPVLLGVVIAALAPASSQRFPKKSFALETRRAAALLGLPADDDWVLYAPYNDKSLMRNVLAYETTHRLGRYASRTRWVELTLNGRPHGVYVLMERPPVPNAAPKSSTGTTNSTSPPTPAASPAYDSHAEPRQRVQR